MNYARRRELAKAQDLIEKIKSDYEELKRIVENAAEEERLYYDEMPESFLGGGRGTAADEAATALEEVQSTLEELDLDDLISKIEDAKS